MRYPMEEITPQVINTILKDHVISPITSDTEVETYIRMRFNQIKALNQKSVFQSSASAIEKKKLIMQAASMTISPELLQALKDEMYVRAVEALV